ncbi:MAG: peptidase T [Clostridia bacterium]|nr:peptidase T [Clostridia bacterium]
MRAYERLLKYVVVNTTSHEENEAQVPSGAGEFDLARLLADEMKALGLEGVRVDEHAYTYGFLPATPGYESVPALGLNAHLDTVDDCGGTDTHPQVIRNYDGGPVTLGASGKKLDPAQFPHLRDCVGKTLLVTDGTSVLGADDKAGIAIIMTAAERLLTDHLPHGKLCLCFSPDEEIGHGARLLDLEAFGAEYAYTLDGSAPNMVEYETFNAAQAKLLFHGFSVHPGSAKDKMLNAQLIAMEANGMLPPEEIPARTEGYEGFYHLTDMQGTVSEASLTYILRDHDADRFETRKARMREIASRLNEKYGPGTVVCEIRDQYRNMAEVIRKNPVVLELAKTAIREVGLTPECPPVRGGTDGAQLSLRGLPCPNLGTGGYAYHGPYEHAVAEEMDQSVDILMNIVRLFTELPRA